MDYQDRTTILAVIGTLLLLVGVAAAFLGPIEMYCFYLFSEGGRFHYQGFGFGSFMFGNIACQIVGYYLVALLLIPLGYGHLRVRRWARTLSLTLLWFWLVTGVPLACVFLFILVTAKELSLVGVLLAVLVVGMSYLVVPRLLIRFYQGRDARLTFETKDANTYWIEGVPMPILVLGALYLFFTIALHVPILFNGLFPLFGHFLSGMQGIVWLDVSILLLVGLTWGTLKMRPWAWWGSLVYFALMTASWVLTLSMSSYLDILSKMNFPPTEMKALQGLPFEGIHFAILLGIPFLITLAVIILARPHFGIDSQT